MKILFSAALLSLFAMTLSRAAHANGVAGEFSFLISENGQVDELSTTPPPPPPAPNPPGSPSYEGFLFLGNSAVELAGDNDSSKQVLVDRANATCNFLYNSSARLVRSKRVNCTSDCTFASAVNGVVVVGEYGNYGSYSPTFIYDLRCRH